MNALLTFFSTYIFLLSSLYFLLWWVVLFISFKKGTGIRRKILLTSLVVMAITPFIEHINLADWWSPVFVSDTFFHIEDLLFGFGITGTTLGIYFWFSRDARREIEGRAVFSLLYKNVLLVTAFLVMFAPFYLFHVPSFYTEIACMILISACVQARIPAMLLPSVLTGIALTLMVFPGYFIATYLHPGWIQEYWLLAGWPGQLLLTIPLGEYAFYFFTGLFIPAFMELLFARHSASSTVSFKVGAWLLRILHVLTVIFILTGWYFDLTNEAHLVVTSIALVSLLTLGYCFLTQWEVWCRQKVDPRLKWDTEYTFTNEIFQGLFGTGAPHRVTKWIAYFVFILTIVANLFRFYL